MKRTKNKWTLVTALEEIWKQAKDSRLSEEYFAQVAEACAYVKSKLNTLYTRVRESAKS